MASRIVCIEGFDLYNDPTGNEVGLGRRFRYYTEDPARTEFGTEAGRLGGRAINRQTDPAFGRRDNFAIRIPAPTGAEEVVVGVAVKMEDDGSAAGQNVLWGIQASGVEGTYVRVSDTGFLQITSRTAGNTPVATSTTVFMEIDLWYYTELRLNPATGFVQLWVNGELALQVVNAQLALSAATINEVALGVSSISAGTTLQAARNAAYDDVYVKYTDDFDNDGRLGDVRVETLLPVSDVSNTMDLEGGATTAAEALQSAATDGRELSADAVGEEARVNIGGFLTTQPQVIHGVGVTLESRKQGAAERALRFGLDSNGTEVSEVSSGQLDTYSNDALVVEQDPDTTSAWTQSAVEALDLFVSLES